MRQLNVYFNNIKAGMLTELLPGKNYRFDYYPTYVRSEFPHISVTIPKSDLPYESEHLFPFFANMLPEGSLRRVICREHHIDEADLFGILYAIADTETIGAVSLKKI